MEKEQDDVVSVILEGGFPKRVHEKHILHPSVYGKMEDMEHAADTMHIYYATWIGRLQHGRASIHLALLLPPPCLLSATRTGIRFSSFPSIATGRWPSDCWNADAGFSLLVLDYDF